MVKSSPSNTGSEISVPHQGPKIPHASGPKNQNIKQKQHCTKFNEDLKKKKKKHNLFPNLLILYFPHIQAMVKILHTCTHTQRDIHPTMNKNTVFSTQMSLITQMNALACLDNGKKEVGSEQKKGDSKKRNVFLLMRWDKTGGRRCQPVSCGEHGLKKPEWALPYQPPRSVSLTS